MKMRKFLILLPTVFAGVALLVSCSSYNRATFSWPSKYPPPRPIEITMIEVEGDPGEKLKIVFNRKSGECLELEVNGIKKECNDPKFVVDKAETYFCVPPHIADREANTDINNDGTLDVYCGNLKFLTDGADIQFKPDSATGNRKCKNVGGDVICY